MPKTKPESKLKNMLSSALKDLHALADADAIIGKPFYTEDGTAIIPVSQITMGFLTGGGQYGEVKLLQKNDDFPVLGGSGAVVSLKPSAFVVANGKNVRLLKAAPNEYERIAEVAEQIVNSLKNDDKI